MSGVLSLAFFAGLIVFVPLGLDYLRKKYWPQSEEKEEGKKSGHIHKFSTINPGSGLPMAGGSFDVGGNAFGSGDLSGMK
jgi:hypothetical protein